MKKRNFYKFPLPRAIRDADIREITFVTKNKGLITVGLPEIGLYIDRRGYIIGIGKDVEIHYSKKEKDYVWEWYSRYSKYSETKEGIIGYIALSFCQDHSDDKN